MRAESLTSIISRSANWLVSGVLGFHSGSSVNMKDQPSGGLRRVARDAMHRPSRTRLRWPPTRPPGRPDRRCLPKAILSNATGVLTSTASSFAKKAIAARPRADHCQGAVQTRKDPGAARMKTLTRSDTITSKSVSLPDRASRCVPRSRSSPLTAISSTRSRAWSAPSATEADHYSGQIAGD